MKPESMMDAYDEAYGAWSDQLRSLMDQGRINLSQCEQAIAILHHKSISTDFFLALPLVYASKYQDEPTFLTLRWEREEDDFEIEINEQGQMIWRFDVVFIDGKRVFDMEESSPKDLWCDTLTEDVFTKYLKRFAWKEST